MTGPIAVAGHTGFIGSRLTRLLEARGERVVGISRSTGDELSSPQWQAPSASPRRIVHLAGRVGVAASWDQPGSYYRSNLISTLQLLEWARLEGAVFVYVSSYVYGPPQYLPVDEAHPINPVNPYARSKRLAEELCEGYARDFGLDVTIVRPFNVYGPGQADDSLVATVVRQIVEDGDVEVRDLRPRRDYLYVCDLARALADLVCDPPQGLEFYNIGAGTSVSVEELIGLAREVAGCGGRTRCSGQPRPMEIPDCYSDSSRLRERLGWLPKLTLREGLARTVAHHRRSEGQCPRPPDPEAS